MFQRTHRMLNTAVMPPPKPTACIPKPTAATVTPVPMASTGTPVPKAAITPPMPPPGKIFIIPYRDREKNKNDFLVQMKKVLADETEPYEIYFAQQCDTRPFNRGAMKNIGFLAMKQKYPTTYGDITFIFHDVDTWPADKGIVHYNATHGSVSHFFGYTFALGGLFAIKGADFEKTQGFPNFWGWGLEDNLMHTRALAAGLTIDRSCFYPITDDVHFIRPFDGFKRLMSQRDVVVFKHETPDSMTHLHHVQHTLNGQFINIYSFGCDMLPEEQVYKVYDIRNGSRIKSGPGFNRRVWSMKKMF